MLGWSTPTKEGLEAEAATMAAGQAISARAEHLAADRLAGVGQDKTLLKYSDDGFETAAEYAEFIEKKRDQFLQENLHAQGQVGAAKDGTERGRWMLQTRTSGKLANQFHAELAKIRQGDGAWDRVQMRAYSDAYRQALAEQRDMGLPGGKMIAVHEESAKTTVARLKKGLAYYPTDWLARDGEQETDGEVLPLKVSPASGRAYYSERVVYQDRRTGEPVSEPFALLTIGKRDDGCLEPGVTTAIHEYGHRAESAQPQVNALAQVHLARRTTTAAGEREEMTGYLVTKTDKKKGAPPDMDDFAARESSQSEWVRPDDFAERYMGKQNSSQDESSEVFTTGMEGLFAGRFGGFRGAGKWRADSEHRNFVLGTLATVK